MQFKHSDTATPVRYNDLYFRIITALIAAHLIVVIGEDETLFQLLVMWDYYRALLFSFLIAFLLVNLVYFITIRLDKRYDWKLMPIQRSCLQLFLGLLLPAGAAYLLAYVYFKANGYAIEHTWYLRYDYPVIVLLLTTLNMYYLAFYFFREWQLSEAKTYTENSIDKVESKVSSSKEIFVVNKGTQNIPLPVTAIAYFFREGDYNFIRTFEKEDYLISETLDDLQKQLSEKRFFRVNRQLIASLAACDHFKTLDYGRLELLLKPAAKEPVIISQKRAKEFKDWIAR